MIKMNITNIWECKFGNANLRQHSAAVKLRLLLLGNVKSYQPSIYMHDLASENQHNIGVITWYFIILHFLVHLH